jgi:hypothetical protein
MRYILEGEWSGYHSGQQRIVHRTVISEQRAKKINEQKLSCITYSDGTSLDLTLRPAKPRERVKESHGYDSLIDDCLHYKVCSVMDLIAARDSRKVE